MTAALEDLDIAEVLAERHRDTPLWNELMAEYDAATLDELGADWPQIYDTTTFDRPANGDDPGDEPDQPQAPPAEDHPPVPAADPQPDEADPQMEPDTPESEPDSDPAE